jgi:class 3 adenylate cyclase/tetratricopeptide (TPR) repeat protein
VKCQNCGRDNRADARFCDACGTAIAPSPGHGGERRQITALFCDIVGFTRLSATLDQEDLHGLLRNFRETVSTIILRWGGLLEPYVGDEVTAYFGLPAHEDDAERAVRAGLEIQAALTARGQDPQVAGAVPLAARIGVHTGSVLVNESGEGEHAKTQALGLTLSVAFRLQGIARPGAVVISETTHRLTSGLFVTEDLGIPQLKGVDEGIHAYVVVRSTGVRGRVDAHPRHGPLVGRAREREELEAVWRQTQLGEGQVALISGDAGIGKSRLVREFTGSLSSGDGRRSFEWRCSPFHQSTPFYPVIEGLEHWGIGRGGASGDRVGKILELFSATGLHLAPPALVESVNLIADIVSPSRSDDESAVHETPVVRRAKTIDLLCDLARAQALKRPSVMVLEDAHWADPSTIDVIKRLSQRCRDVPLLLLLTFRPDAAPQWADISPAHRMSLEPLPSAECAALFDALIGQRAVAAPVRDRLLSRADGVPLFIEELTQAFVEAGSDRTSDLLSSIPDTLQGLLVSRLDRLSSRARETIHLASALSREFRFDVLARVSTVPEQALRADLRELVGLGLIQPGRLGSETYVFKHALVADAAYASILRSDRRRLHAQIAHHLADSPSPLATEQPELLAHHFGEAGEPEKAIEYWRSAGDAAVARGAYQEAVQHFDHGLALLSEVAAGPLRLQREIELVESKGTALFSMLGYAHPEVETTFARALSLCEQEGSPPTLRVLYGLWAVNLSRSNRDAVEALLPRFEELSRSGDPVALLTARANAGMRAFLTGRFEESLALMTEATQWYSTTEHSAFLRRHGYGGGLYPFAWRMWSLSILGRAEEAAAVEHELQVTAEQSRNPYGLVIAGGFRVNLARDRRDPSVTIALAESQIDYARRQMLPLWEGPAHCSRGWACARLGAVSEGLAEITLGLRFLDAVGLRTTYAYHLGGLIETLLAAGDAEAALVEAKRGLSMCETGLDRFYKAELLRLQAECHQRLGDLEAAESGLHDALTLAESQSAMLYVARAAESRVRLRIEQGRTDLARLELEAVIAGLSNQSQTADHATMRQLLETIV